MNFKKELIENYTWYISKWDKLNTSNRNKWIKKIIIENTMISLGYTLHNIQNKYKNLTNEINYRNTVYIKQLIDNNNFDLVQIKVREHMKILLN